MKVKGRGEEGVQKGGGGEGGREVTTKIRQLPRKQSMNVLQSAELGLNLR